MRTTFGTSIPPGITSATRGQLKLRIDRVVLDQPAIAPIVGGTDGARRVCETPYVSFHFWGGEDRPSPVVSPSSLSTRTGPVAIVFPIKTSRAQCEAYFNHMTVAKSGLEIRVLMHDIKTSRDAKMVQSARSLGGNANSRDVEAQSIQNSIRTHHVTQAETASATLGRALVRLDDLSTSSPTAGWFSIVTLPEDSNGFSNIATSTVLGRMKLSLSLEYFADVDKNKTKMTTSSRNTADAGRSRSSSGGGNNKQQGRLENKLYSRNKRGIEDDAEFIDDNDDDDLFSSNHNNNAHDGQLVVIGKAIDLHRHRETENEDQTQQQHQQKSASGSRSSSNSKPPIPKIIAKQSNESSSSKPTNTADADALFAAGLKLRQQLAAASQGGETTEDVEARTRLQNQMMMMNSGDQQQQNLPYSRLTLNRAPHEDEEDPYATSKKNRKAAKKIDKYGGYSYNNDDDESDDSDDVETYMNNYLENEQNSKIHDKLLQAGYPTERIAKMMLGRSTATTNQHPQHQQKPTNTNNTMRNNYNNNVHQDPFHSQQQIQSQQQQQHQHQSHQNILPTRASNNQFYAGSGGGGGGGGEQQQQQQPLVGQFVVRVCVGQLAMQAPCAAVKLVARFSPDVLFTVPPELGCFVSPDVALPIADDDVVGFNVCGIRRLTSASRVVVELYAKPINNHQNNNDIKNGSDEDDFTLVGLSMAPICSSAGVGVLRNVILRNPLNAGNVAAQCDLYVNFFQEIHEAQETNRMNNVMTNSNNNNNNARNEDDVNENNKKQPSNSRASSTSQPRNNNFGNVTQQRQGNNDENEDDDDNHQDTFAAPPALTGSLVPTAATNLDDRNTFTGHLVIEVLEAKNLKPVQDGDLVSAPSTFVVIDDVMIQLISSLKQQSVKNTDNHHLQHINSSQQFSSTSFDLVNGLEVSANDWETRGPDASRVACETSKPQYNFQTEIFLGSDLFPGNQQQFEDAMISSTKKKLSHIHISIHHCRNKNTSRKFSQSSLARMENDSNTNNNNNNNNINSGLYLDPERDAAILELLQNSVELGVAAIPMANCMSPRLMFPFDGWVHVMDDVTGCSVGQVRVRCQLK